MLMDAIRLDMNEMPYAPPRSVLAAARTALPRLNRYTDLGTLQQLRELLAEYVGVPKRHVLLSPGSDLLLREMIYVLSRGRRMVTVSPSFLPTLQTADRFAPRRLAIRLEPPDFSLDPDLLMHVLEGPSLVIIDNPNNPTGVMLLDRNTVARVAERKEAALLVIDEAYFEFSGVTFAEMVMAYPHLCIVRTLDKAFGLAGARVGYAIAGDSFLEALPSQFVFLPQPSLYAAIEALRNPVYMQRNVRRLIRERERLRDVLRSLGSDVHRSSTNFLLVRTQVPDVTKRLEEQGIHVSDVSNQLPAGCIRVSVGTREENEAFIASYREIMAAL